MNNQKKESVKDKALKTVKKHLGTTQRRLQTSEDHLKALIYQLGAEVKASYKSEKAAKRNKMLSDTIFENSVLPKIIIENDSTISRVNKSFEK
ncbi:MAG: hypothetical protein U9O97_06000, partial [Elusimicrobiota bacterium]|nr:hypothetical protein [Elusimicrobiota bacterium]